MARNFRRGEIPKLARRRFLVAGRSKLTRTAPVRTGTLAGLDVFFTAPARSGTLHRMGHRGSDQS